MQISSYRDGSSVNLSIAQAFNRCNTLPTNRRERRLHKINSTHTPLINLCTAPSHLPRLAVVVARSASSIVGGAKDRDSLRSPLRQVSLWRCWAHWLDTRCVRCSPSPGCWQEEGDSGGRFLVSPQPCLEIVQLTTARHPHQAPGMRKALQSDLVNRYWKFPISLAQRRKLCKIKSHTINFRYIWSCWTIVLS